MVLAPGALGVGREADAEAEEAGGVFDVEVKVGVVVVQVVEVVEVAGEGVCSMSRATTDEDEAELVLATLFAGGTTRLCPGTVAASGTATGALSPADSGRAPTESVAIASVGASSCLVGRAEPFSMWDIVGRAGA